MIIIFIVVVILIGVVAFTVYARRKREAFLEAHPDVTRIKLRLARTFPELNAYRLLKGDASYTLDKSKIYVCTRDKRTKREYDDNMLTYVTLHELAHCLTPEIGHGTEFKKTFASLIGRAISNNLYDPTIPRVRDYCV